MDRKEEMTAHERAATALLQVDRVRAWLRAEEPTAIVGTANEGSACPPYRYLCAHDIDDCFVGSTGSVELYGDAAGSVELSDDLRAFVAAIDGDGITTRAVRAAECLALLDRIAPEATS